MLFAFNFFANSFLICYCFTKVVSLSTFCRYTYCVYEMYVISWVNDLASCFHSVCFTFHDDNLITLKLVVETCAVDLWKFLCLHGYYQGTSGITLQHCRKRSSSVPLGASGEHGHTPGLRRLVDGLSRRRFGFNPRPICGICDRKSGIRTCAPPPRVRRYYRVHVVQPLLHTPSFA